MVLGPRKRAARWGRGDLEEHSLLRLFEIIHDFPTNVPNGHVIGRVNLYLFKRMTIAIEHQCSSTGKSRPFEFPTIDGHQERQRVESRDSFRRVSALEYLGNVRMHDLSPTLIRSSEASCRSLCFIKRNPI
jgi:hypothetical protein